jgi:hypothetical protein
MRKWIVCVMFVAAGSAMTRAQWLKLTLPDTPRNADGTPNFAAPIPRTSDGKPDLSGIWAANKRLALQHPEARAKFPDGPMHLEWFVPGTAGVPLLPGARALYQEREKQFGAGSPPAHCLPRGVPIHTMAFSLTKIVQNPRVTLILFEESNHYRQVFTDGRGLPDDPQPTWFGYSVGRWDADTFIVETNGYNDLSWMDDAGLPHSDALRTTERFTRRDFGHLAVTVTFDDPKSYSRPWAVNLPFELQADTELIEDVCDNERDSAHYVGK